MDRSIDRGLNLIKAKLLRLRQLVACKRETKPLIERLTTQELRNLTLAQMTILEVARRKDAAKTPEEIGYSDYNDYFDGTYNGYDDYCDVCSNSHYDAE